MLRLIFALLFKLSGFRIENQFPEASQRCVMVAGPHTSNWDLVYTVAAFRQMKIPLYFTIKKEWMRFPFRYFIKPLGGIAIDRSPQKAGEPRKGTVEAMAQLFEKHEHMALVVTIEGTRKKVDQIKTGFYHVARQANVPIVFGFLDYGKRIAGVGKSIDPNRPYEEVQREMYSFFGRITPKFPEMNSFREKPPK